MQCFIYKGSKKSDSYLYVRQNNDFSDVPNQLLELLGKLDCVMELDLSARDTLAQVDINVVKTALRQQGYFYQIPPKDYVGS